MYDIENWDVVKRLDYEIPSDTNHVYVPLVNKERTRLCMDYGNSKIEFDNQFFFQRELDFIHKFTDYPWCPKIHSIDINKKTIFIDFTESCNNIIYTGRSLDDYCPDWKNQLKTIIKDIEAQNVYKLTLQPHSFFIKDQQLYTFDFYASVEKDDAVLPVSQVKHVIGQKSEDRWLESTFGDYVDFSIFYKQGIEKHIVEWPVQLTEIL